MSGEAIEPVSTRISRMVPAGKVARFEPLLHETITAARGFDGHLGLDVLRPDGGGVYQIVFRYRSRAEHEAWMSSDQRRELGIDHGLLVEDTDVVRARLTGSPLASWRHLLGVPLSAARGMILLARGMEMPAFSDRDLRIVLRIANESATVFDDALRARELARLLAPLRDEQPATTPARVGVSS